MVNHNLVRETFSIVAGDNFSHESGKRKFLMVEAIYQLYNLVLAFFRLALYCCFKYSFKIL